MNEQISDTDDFRARARARGEAKNAAARAALEPLAPGERPTAVTVASIAAMVMALGNLTAYLLSDDSHVGREVVQLSMVVGALFAASIGMWFMKYWAVLGFQTVLGLQIIVLCLALTRVDGVLVALLFVSIVIASGVLFWFLIRAMARIQMPESPAERQLREHEQSLNADSEEPGDE